MQESGGGHRHSDTEKQAELSGVCHYPPPGSRHYLEPIRSIISLFETQNYKESMRRCP